MVEISISGCVKMLILTHPRLGGEAPSNCSLQNYESESFFYFHFALRSPNFARCARQVRLRLGRESESFFTFTLLFAHLTLLATLAKLGYTSAKPNEKKLFFVWLCVRFALTLHGKRRNKSEKGLLCEYTYGVYYW